jgi:hypothetical protein
MTLAIAAACMHIVSSGREHSQAHRVHHFDDALNPEGDSDSASMRPVSPHLARFPAQFLACFFLQFMRFQQ